MALDTKVIISSFELAKPIGPQVVDKFYEILWRDYPAAKGLFANVDMEKQKKQLLNSLVHIVGNIEKPEALMPYLKSMGGRHVQYGTAPEHYALVGDALLKTFAFFFKEKWTPELKAQWTEAYGIIAKTMQEGAREASNQKKAA